MLNAFDLLRDFDDDALLLWSKLELTLASKKALEMSRLADIEVLLDEDVDDDPEKALDALMSASLERADTKSL